MEVDDHHRRIVRRQVCHRPRDEDGAGVRQQERPEENGEGQQVRPDRRAAAQLPECPPGREQYQQTDEQGDVLPHREQQHGVEYRGYGCERDVTDGLGEKCLGHLSQRRGIAHGAHRCRRSEDDEERQHDRRPGQSRPE